MRKKEERKTEGGSKSALYRHAPSEVYFFITMSDFQSRICAQVALKSRDQTAVGAGAQMRDNDHASSFIISGTNGGDVLTRKHTNITKKSTSQHYPHNSYVLLINPSFPSPPQVYHRYPHPKQQTNNAHPFISTPHTPPV